MYSVVSLSFIFSHPPEVEKKKKSIRRMSPMDVARVSINKKFSIIMAAIKIPLVLYVLHSKQVRSYDSSVFIATY